MKSKIWDALKALVLTPSRKVSPAAGAAESTHQSDVTLSPKQMAKRTLPQNAPITWSAEDQAKASAQTGADRVGTPVQIATDRVIPSNREAGEVSNKKRAAGDAVALPVKPEFILQKTGEFHPHPLFIEETTSVADSGVPTHSGVSRQLCSDPKDETDLIIGLDFGTSATKIVIRDTYAGRVFPVEVNHERHGVERYLQPSCVYFDEGVFSFSGKGQRLDDLKLSLLACMALLPVTEFNHCCAFLALIIRKSRGWLLTEHEAIYRQHRLNWFINLGIAARSYQDEAKVQLFRRLAWAAANLASDASYPQITLDSVDKYRKLSQQVFGSQAQDAIVDVEFLTADIGVVPEVSAQIQGFMTSARWDWKNRPIMMLVDVGAGTVDAALFHVRSSKESGGVLTFYSSRVEANGAMNLHRERVSWLKKSVPKTPDFEIVHEYLKAIAKPTGRLRPIPTSVIDYLPGFQFREMDSNLDDKFKIQRYRTQVAGSINEAKTKKGLGAKGSQQLQGVPLLLCGGGSRLPIYSSIATEINQTPNWDVGVEVTLMPVPVELKDAGWHLEDFDRISVAYGLSLQQSLEKIVRAIDVPDVKKPVSSDGHDRYVSKDQC